MDLNHYKEDLEKVMLTMVPLYMNLEGFQIVTKRTERGGIVRRFSSCAILDIKGKRSKFTKRIDLEIIMSLGECTIQKMYFNYYPGNIISLIFQPPTPTPQFFRQIARRSIVKDNDTKILIQRIKEEMYQQSYDNG